MFIANIPEGLASDAGLSRTGMSQHRILLIWGLVPLACTLSPWLAFELPRENGAFVQATLMSIAGGGILAMT